MDVRSPHATPRTTPRVTVSVHLAALVVGSVLLALSGVLTGGMASASGAATPRTGWLRVGHLAPGTPSADVRLTPYAGGRPTMLRDVGYGEVSPYRKVAVGLYTVSLVRAGSPRSATPMISQNVRVEEGVASTVVATGTGADVAVSVLPDDLQPPPPGEAKVRLLSAVTTSRSIDASIRNGPTLARDVTTGGSTGYASVAAQTWAVQIGAKGASTSTTDVQVRAGRTYTLIALDQGATGIQLRAVEDSGMSAAPSGLMPQGGVPTGEGGLARQAQADQLAATLALGGLAVLAVAAAWARRRSTG